MANCYFRLPFLPFPLPFAFTAVFFARLALRDFVAAFFLTRLAATLLGFGAVFLTAFFFPATRAFTAFGLDLPDTSAPFLSILPCAFALLTSPLAPRLSSLSPPRSSSFHPCP